MIVLWLLKVLVLFGWFLGFVFELGFVVNVGLRAAFVVCVTWWTILMVFLGFVDLLVVSGFWGGLLLLCNACLGVWCCDLWDLQVGLWDEFALCVYCCLD